MEPRGGRVGEMGRGGNELFISRNAEGSGIGLGFSREVGGDSLSSRFRDEPWEQQVSTWDKSSVFGVPTKAQGGFGTH